MRIRLAAYVIAGFALSVVACRDSVESSPALPDIVLITLDTTRADHLGLYGYFRPTSPHLDRLATESLVFERLIVPMSTTLPTHTSLFTGTYPDEHGVLGNVKHGAERFVPSPLLESFTSYLRGLGMDTAAFVSATPLRRGSGLEVDFEVFDQPKGIFRPSRRTTGAALRWLHEQPVEAPFFLSVHYFDPHWPYEPIDEAKGYFQDDEALARFLAPARHPRERDRRRRAPAGRRRSS